MWSAVGHIRMAVVQHDALPKCARMHCCDGSIEISEGSTELWCTDTDDRPPGCRSTKGE
jgi:hypothetical protein